MSGKKPLIEQIREWLKILPSLIKALLDLFRG